MTLSVCAIWRCREGGSVDGRAARRVGDHHVVTEELGDVLDVRSLAAACAGARELEQWLGELRVLHALHLVQDSVLVAYLGVEVIEVLLLVNLLEVGSHLERRNLLGGSRADIDAVAAACAVGDRDRDGELVALEVGLSFRHLESFRSLCGLFLVHEERTDDGVRADIRAVVALDAGLRIPYRNRYGHAALLECRSSCRHGAVHVRHECANRERITILGVNDIGDFLYECRSETILVRILELCGNLSPLGRNLHLCVLTATVNGCEVHVYDVLSLLAVALYDGVLHILDGVLVRENSGNLEEGALEDGVCPPAESDLGSDLGRVDDVELDVLLADDGLYVVRKTLDGLFLVPEAVEKEAAAVLDALEHIIFIEI